MRKRRVIAISALLLALSASAAAGQDLAAYKQEALQETEQLRETLRHLAQELWRYAETALQEERSAALLAEALEAEGFRVQRGVAGMPTAFIAEWGSGRPIIGILAEYDALPGVGNAPVPERHSREDGVSSGHGCGHNLFGAASTVGAIVLKRMMERHRIPGTVRLYGTPAEETVVGKVYMARAGVFDDLDAAIEWHPGTETAVRNQPGRAMNNFIVRFHGQAAHASADPWNGRSALDAVELMNHAANMMREHVHPTARIHYVITDGGEAPNVVPERAEVWYYVRDINRERVEFMYEWLKKMAEGAALMTRTEYEIEFITGVHEVLLNRPLQEAVQANLELVGPPRFDAQEQQFARRLQEFLKIEPVGLDTTIKPLPEGPEPPRGGSTDVAEVSWITPTVGFTVATAARNVPWHSWATTACHGTSIGYKGAEVAAKVIAATGLDMLLRPELLQAAREEFLRLTGGRPYQSPLPPDQPPPLPSRTDR
ncbi:amidohydrolase [Rhodothermus marinus SG0.5JP17-172]|uniref:amidohydrolase n=1 Tax=Rhodothermus marinus TaxID=29549 RepID=UPI000223D727|nr:amidohydrolase [Rhodothermus marinus]AEN72288.1 amidohydrolase [Rhodothermus marinus SG0.5JP17-172]